MSVFSSSLAPFFVSFLHILRYLIAVLQNNFQLALIRAKRFSRQCALRVFAFYAVHYYSTYSLTVTIVSVFNRARFVAVLLFLYVKCSFTETCSFLPFYRLTPCLHGVEDPGLVG